MKRVYDIIDFLGDAEKYYIEIDTTVYKRAK